MSPKLPVGTEKETFGAGAPVPVIAVGAHTRAQSHDDRPPQHVVRVQSGVRGQCERVAVSRSGVRRDPQVRDTFKLALAICGRHNAEILRAAVSFALVWLSPGPRMMLPAIVARQVALGRL